MCVCVYLVVSKVIVQCVFQFTKELLFFFFLSVFSLLEDRQFSKSVYLYYDETMFKKKEKESLFGPDNDSLVRNMTNKAQ